MPWLRRDSFDLRNNQVGEEKQKMQVIEISNHLCDKLTADITRAERERAEVRG